MKNTYKFINYLIPFGIIAVLCFTAHDVLGSLLWSGYNPITDYVSKLTADGAPNVFLTRTLLYGYTFGQVIFFAGMFSVAICSYGVILRIGYGGLLLTALVAAFGYGTFPMTMDFVVNYKNYVHLLVTIVILAGTAAMLFILAIGYLRRKNYNNIGYTSLTAAILFVLFNLLHLYLILTGSKLLGLAQRMTFYSFLCYTAILSGFYMKKSCNEEIENVMRHNDVNKNIGDI